MLTLFLVFIFPSGDVGKCVNVGEGIEGDKQANHIYNILFDTTVARVRGHRAVE